MFCARYVGAGGAGVRRACLSLVRKMVHYAPAPRLRALSSPRAAALLTRLVATVLDAQVSRRASTAYVRMSVSDTFPTSQMYYELFITYLICYFLLSK